MVIRDVNNNISSISAVDFKLILRLVLFSIDILNLPQSTWLLLKLGYLGLFKELLFIVKMLE